MKLFNFLHQTLSSIFTRAPFLLVSITCCIAGLAGWRLLLLGFVADIVLNLFILYFWDARYHYKEYKKEYEPYLQSSKLVDDEVIQMLKAEREKVDYSYYSAQRKLGNNMDVVVYVSNDPNISPSTLPSSAGKSIILFPKQYNHEIKNIAQMAHEFGHTNHGLLMQEKGVIISASIIFFVFSVIAAIFGKITGWIVFLLSLSGLFTLFTLLFFRYKHKTLREYNADLLACQMLENIYGEEYMRKAAGELLNLRINQCRQSSKQMETFLFTNCMSIPAHYADDERFNYLLKKSRKMENSIRDNEFLDKHKKERSISREKNIQKHLLMYRNNKIATFYMTSINPSDVLGLIFQFCVLSMLILRLSTAITIPAGFLKVGFAFLLVAFLVLIILYNIVCLKDRNLMNQLGKM